MSSKGNWRDELQQAAEILRNPFKMRMAVAGVTLVVMCFAISDPLEARLKQTDREMARTKNKVRAAEEVMLLRSHLEAVESRIMRGKSNDIVVSHLIDIVRSEPVDLMRIDAQTAEKLGPLQSVRVMIDVTGSFTALAQLLYRFDSDQYLIRVEAISIQPPQKNESELMMSVSLQIMKDSA